VRRGRARTIEVGMGADDGIHTEIVSGLNPDDEVVMEVIRGAIADGLPVSVVSRNE
jgi:hypothetical protein